MHKQYDDIHIKSDTQLAYTVIVKFKKTLVFYTVQEPLLKKVTNLFLNNTTN